MPTKRSHRLVNLVRQRATVNVNIFALTDTMTRLLCLIAVTRKQPVVYSFFSLNPYSTMIEMSSTNRHPFYRSSTPFPTSSSSPSSHLTPLDSESVDPISFSSSFSSLYRGFNSSPLPQLPSPCVPVWPSDEVVHHPAFYEAKPLEAYPTCKSDPAYPIHKLCFKEPTHNIDLSTGVVSASGRSQPENDIKADDQAARVKKERITVYERQSSSTTMNLSHKSCTATSVFSIERVSRIYPLVKLSVERYTALRQIQIEELGITVTGEQDEEQEKIPLGWIGEEVGEGIINLLDTHSFAQWSDQSEDD